MPDLLWSLLQQASSQGSRSTAMNPLVWVLGVLLAALVAVSRMPNLPSYVAFSLMVFAAIAFIAFLVAYFLLLFKNPDALRSEKFTLSKLAIERALRATA